jgi:hypothetical protein
MKLLYLSAIESIFLLSCSKSDPVRPSANASNMRLNVSTSASTLVFAVTIDRSSSSDVSLQYATRSGTAIENKDFVPKSGVLIIPAGGLTGSIEVNILGDSTRKMVDFWIDLSNPKNCTLQKSSIEGTLINEDGRYFPVDNVGYSTPNQYAGYTLVWSDEFSGKSINESNWGFDIGNNGGWGNHELEFYTNSTKNAFVSQGNLIIEAREESISGFKYSSARMITQHKQSFKYGRVDIRAKLPQGNGMWPALWMLGSNFGAVDWPTCGEIDIVELLGSEPYKIYGTVHWGASRPQWQFYETSKLSTGSFTNSFHVFSMIWDQYSISILVDDVSYFSMLTTPESPTFNLPFFLIFNVAVGGDWPGSPDGSTALPQRMVVDYVRVFQ